jgi:hypothetical protein
VPSNVTLVLIYFWVLYIESMALSRSVDKESKFFWIEVNTTFTY